jgi:ABC-2 type transport system ATP-binding protein
VGHLSHFSNISAADFKQSRTKLGDVTPNPDKPATSHAVIAVDHLTKDYGQGRGVFDISFEVARGEALGFVGPNGAGKTTAIRHLMGFTKPQSGRTAVASLDCWEHPSQMLRDVGYLPGEIALPDGLTGWQFIRFMQRLRGSRDSAHVAKLLQLFQFDPNAKTKRMSLGDKRKLAVVTAFMDDPMVLLLDEPTSGLDPIMQGRFTDFLHQEKERGKTILLSSHMFLEVEAVCDRVAVIKDGHIVGTVRTGEIRHSQDKTYLVTFATLADFQAFLTDSERLVNAANQSTRSVEVQVLAADLNLLIRRLAGRRVASFKERNVSLSEYFLGFCDTAPKGGGHDGRD